MMRGHHHLTYSADTIRKSTLTFDKEREAERRHREADAEFSRLDRLAIWNGENLPAGTPKPVRPLVLTG